MLTVRQLRELLATIPDHTLVTTADDFYDYAPGVSSIKLLQLKNGQVTLNLTPGERVDDLGDHTVVLWKSQKPGSIPEHDMP